MDKITKSLLSNFSSQFELEHLDEFKKFEYFINYLVTTKIYHGSFELEDIYTGGGNDCGIDGLCIIANGQMVFNVEALNDILDNKATYLDVDIICIQSKSSSSFDSGEINNFLSGAYSFFYEDQPKSNWNTKICQMKNTWDAIISKSSLMSNRKPNCKLFYVCTGTWVEDANLVAKFSYWEQQLRALNLFNEIQITPIDANSISDYHRQVQNKVSTTINFSTKITLPQIEGITEAYLGLLPYHEYLKLIQDSSENMLNIFDENVRDFQGENSVNKKIKETLDQGKFDLFCVLNNGVTVVAASIIPVGNSFTIKDYQVVNGCQTTNVLHSARKQNGIENLFVPIKIIVAKNDDIKTQITLATNSQTEVKAEQLASLNNFQRKLEDYYKAEKKGVALYYERRSQQYNSDQSIKKTAIISIPIQIKSFAAIFLTAPHSVSGYYGTIMKKFGDTKIFSDKHKLSPYYASSLCYYRIEQFFRSRDLEAKYKKARYQLMLLVRLIVVGEDIPSLESNKIDIECNKFIEKLIDEVCAKKLFDEAVRLFELSEIDKNKDQYKSESDTQLILDSFHRYFNP